VPAGLEAEIGLFVLVLGRTGGLVAAAPLLSSRAVPAPVRALLSALLALGVTPAVAPPAGGVPQQVLPFAVLLLREVGIGALLGLLAQTVVAAAQLAGTYCDIEFGLTLGALVDPLNDTSTTVFSQWFGTLGTLVFVAAGGLEALAEVLALSYRHLPLGGGGLFLGAGVGVALGALGWAMVASLGVAAPLLGLGFLLNVLLGAASRAMPQMNALQSVLPAQLLLGLGVLVLGLPAIVAGFGQLVPEVLVWVGRLWA
jgi:flagellar biosynthetic protein FliR